MPSPFPGMDPYIEAPFLWSDFHLCMLAAMREALNAVLPAGYVAAADVHVWSDDPDKEEAVLLGRRDVPIVEEGSHNGGVATAVQHATAPRVGRLPEARKRTRRYLRIHELQTSRVITVIELLSPSNKTPGKDQDVYLSKRDEYLATGTNLVEIDLLRSGKRPPPGDEPPLADYCYLISRSWEFPSFGIWPIDLQDALPDLHVPLAENESDAIVPMRNCLDRCYDGGRYSVRINYKKPPTIPLTERDATWSRELLERQTAH